MTLNELKETIDCKRAELMSLLGDIKSGKHANPLDKVEEVKRRNEELDELCKALHSMREAEKAVAADNKMAPLPPMGSEAKTDTVVRSLGQMFVESTQYKTYGPGGPHGWPEAATFDVDLKAVFRTGAGWAPEVLRTDRVVLSAQRPPTILDVIPTTETTMAAVQYMHETTFTNTAAETAEDGAYPEATLVLSEVTVPVRKIAVHLPVTDEQLDDVPRVRDYVDNRLAFMLMQRLNTQVITGDNTGANLDGILRAGRGIQTQAKGTDSAMTAIFKAITRVRHTGFAEPTAILLHPSDWQDIRVTATADGVYLYGSPADAGPERLWGLPVIVNSAVTENTGIVGDFLMYSELAYRRGVDIQVGYSGTDFRDGRKTIRADVRVAFVLYRPAAFCSVTGI